MVYRYVKLHNLSESTFYVLTKKFSFFVTPFLLINFYFVAPQNPS